MGVLLEHGLPADQQAGRRRGEGNAEGYVVKATGEVIAYGDKRVKASPDGEYHWCAHQAGIDEGHTICLFVPPGGS
jgi:hypothetical protein